MLGRFLEFSIPTPDIGASLAFYERLGFSQAEVGEAWPHPYAVLTDGRLYLGLHQSNLSEAVLTFVRPDLRKSLPLIERQGVEFEYQHLGDDVFNEVAWRDPSGQLLRLVEARTFSPSKRLASAQSSCGYFREIALPAHDRETAKEFWERWGFVGIEEADDLLPHIGCTSDTIDVGLYERGHINRPTRDFSGDRPARHAARLDLESVHGAGRHADSHRRGTATNVSFTRISSSTRSAPIITLNGVRPSSLWRSGNAAVAVSNAASRATSKEIFRVDTCPAIEICTVAW
jgi:catechol 2,3-dioxygenase-like lactoylglutathione lyase family enzyme